MFTRLLSAKRNANAPRHPAEAIDREQIPRTASPATAESTLTLAVGMASKRGPRERNEDAASISSSHDLFAIADGIGGAPLGDIMSTASCNAAVSAYEEGASLFEAFNEANLTAIELKQLLWTHNALTENLSPLTTAHRSGGAERKLREHAARLALPTAGAGSTILLAERKDTHLNLVWAGDTIALLLRGNALRLAAAPDNVQGTNELGSAVGYEATATPRFATYDLEPGDRILLCTDGVWGTLDEERLSELLRSSDNAPWLAQIITKEAADLGTDNATAIVLIAERADPTPNVECAAAAEVEARLETLPLPAVPCTPNYPTFRCA